MAQRILVAGLVTVLGCGETTEEPQEAFETLGELLPACEPLRTSDEIDFTTGCTLGVCGGESYQEVTEILGDSGDCETPSWSDDNVVCEWSNGLQMTWDDEDEDSVPDESDSVSYYTLEDGFEGASLEGLGLAVSGLCFVETFGTPEELELELIGSEYCIDQIDLDFVVVYTNCDDPTQAGLVDRITVWGPEE